MAGERLTEGESWQPSRRAAAFAAPGHHDSPVELKARYENFIGGQWVAPVNGEYTDN